MLSIGLLIVLCGMIPVSLPNVAAASAPTAQLGPRPLIGTYTCSATSPCPMGIADYGVNKKTDYSYKASEFLSWANFTKLTIGGSKEITVQQNTVAYGVYEVGKGRAISGVYWIQDVPVITQAGTSYTIQLENNIWNFSSTTAEMSGTIFGNQQGDCSQTGGQPTFYYCVGAQTITTTLPFSIEMIVTTSVLTSGTHSGASDVTFAIYVYHGSTLAGGAEYDSVAFNGKVKGGASPWFQVGGSNPYGLNDDAETVMCGPGGGSSTPISKVSATMSEFYFPTGSSTRTPIPHAWSAGSDTAETVSGVKMSAFTTTSGIHTGVAKSGTDVNKQLF